MPARLLVTTSLFSPADVFSTIVMALSVYTIHRIAMNRALQAH